MNIHLIGNAHIDPVWLWRWQEGFAEIKATFAAACDRIREYGDFVFTSACASYYEWVEENAPELFEQIRGYVRDGRWVLVGGWWLQPDCNLPSGEAFARHALYSQRYFREKFGVTATVGYNVDSFGHSASLPKLLRGAGMDAYFFLRPGDHEQELPYLFWWESPDGSRVLAAKISASYGDRLTDLPGALERMHAVYPGNDAPLFYGVGNHGGGPTVKMIETLRAYRGDDRLIFSDPRRFADSVRTLPGLPVVRDELQHHASGCYSTMSAHKKANRTAEARLLAAERWDTVASALFSVPAASEKLTGAWKDVLFNQFHDIMGGCSIREAYDDALAAMGGAIHTADTVRNAAMQRISWAIDTKRGKNVPLSKDFDARTWESEMGGAPHVIFNPHPFPVTAAVELNSRQSRVEDENGTPLPIQTVRASRTNGRDDKFNTLLSLTLPPLSYRTVFACRDLPSPEAANPFVVTETSISNGLVTVRLDPETGCIAGFTAGGRERLAAPSAARVIDCSDADTWAHGIFTFDREVGRFRCESVSIRETGPVRATVRVVSRYRGSVLRQDISLLAGDDAVHVKVFLDWREENRMLKLCFPIAGEPVRAAYEQPFGSIVRDHGSHEEPGHAWAEAGGLALLNDAKYSYSLTPVSGGVSELRLTAVRSAVYADHYGVRDDDCICMDIGRQEFCYALRAHDAGTDYSALFRVARALCMPPEVVPESYHEGKLPLSASFVSSDCENVLLEALKPGEDGGIVLRVFETAGRPARAAIRLPFLGKTVLADLAPNGVKTLRITEDGAAEVNLYEV
ncbi:MAG: glycoside hydrolase family 38 C-terminal domain-containing protein [Clostridiaceae bacterium]|nr:glycoside hydrolase family 38 C-terminal domain-containing protein [Clostridiaceae bacterium]